MLRGIFNPCDLASSTWLFLYVLNRIALYAIDSCIRVVVSSAPIISPTTRRLPASRYDVTFLSVNSIVEYTFTLHIFKMMRCLDTPLSVVWTPLRWYALVWCDDVMYTVLHRVLHWPGVYGLIHAHHHRITRPSLGYVDAGNEHPVEQMAALMIHIASIRAVRLLIDIDAVVVFTHVMVKTAAACLNHSNRDVVLHLGLGVEINPRYHHEHHIRRRCNYTQLIPSLDRTPATRH